ncbi:MAG: hypothetical protein KC414_09720 [Romboutsia sp.]|nr:hypothetical protein [Romboutsia sp.]
MTKEEYLEFKQQAYNEFGILLNQSELALFEDTDFICEEKYTKLLEMSRKVIDNTLALQLGSLEEAERAKNEAIKLHSEAEQLRKIAETKTEITEKELVKEREFRLSLTKNDFQRTMAYILSILVGISLILPYIITVSDKITDSTQNLALILIQALTMIVAYLFASRQQNDKNI